MGQKKISPMEACQEVARNPEAMASLLFFLAMREARRYKWIKSQDQGKDVGQEAVVEWFHMKDGAAHWYRDKWVQHLFGKKFWREFDKEEFDLAGHHFPAPDTLKQIMKSVEAYGENLGLIRWCHETKQDEKQFLCILKNLDINNHREEQMEDSFIKTLSEALDEADKYKWLKSEKAGKDLGEQAIYQWFTEHWKEWLAKLT